MRFTCSAQQTEERLVATVAGDVDLAAHPRFQAEADAWAGKGADVVLDLSGVTFMDSMGLRVLVELRQAVVDAGHAFALAAPSRPVDRVLALAGLDKLFDLAEPLMELEPQAEDPAA
jgi:anti-anti-sigma factor